MNNFIRQAQQRFAQDFTSMMLRIFIIVWALIVVVAALFVENKWILAGMLAYEVLP